LDHLRASRKEKKSEIRKAKREMWQTFLTRAERDDVWKALEFTKPAMNIALPVLHDETGNTAPSIKANRQMCWTLPSQYHHLIPLMNISLNQQATSTRR
jgi:hypothetical protein